MAIVNKILLILLLTATTRLASAQTLQAALQAIKKQDFQEALRILRPLAEQGDAKAQNNLGKLI